ncbi:hypothetical protein NN3_18430 [Nocardia neocaledoniensis NBRC 108232]|uniref:Uncharacterized protein n=1 Tax=Nocardia neocaledoniensis TaxID=236511 RepID=A0A317N586_9NOCA|nr:hypothetical protein [Nocardia neocaledoniensis]PWV70436.1 hypothetical protein DFR69_113150 [Nocardia neocaledoniensis]GEM30836.1 hypothetical protein NN3_18430 [Nocardia neocaledoniensis NBRC 108232]
MFMQEQLRFGGKIGPDKFNAPVAAAQVIPLPEVTRTPGLTELTTDRNWRVTHTIADLRWVMRPVRTQSTSMERSQAGS